MKADKNEINAAKAYIGKAKYNSNYNFIATDDDDVFAFIYPNKIHSKALIQLVTDAINEILEPVKGEDIEAKWEPKYLEEVEVSDDGSCWFKWKFIGFSSSGKPIAEGTVLNNIQIWNQIRPIAKPVTAEAELYSILNKGVKPNITCGDFADLQTDILAWHNRHSAPDLEVTDEEILDYYNSHPRVELIATVRHFLNLQQSKGGKG